MIFLFICGGSRGIWVHTKRWKIYPKYWQKNQKFQPTPFKLGMSRPGCGDSYHWKSRLYPPGIKHGNEQSPINEGFIRKTCAKTKKINGELSTAMFDCWRVNSCSFPKKTYCIDIVPSPKSSNIKMALSAKWPPRTSSCCIVCVSYLYIYISWYPI